jgi:hypothetical protein
MLLFLVVYAKSGIKQDHVIGIQNAAIRQSSYRSKNTHRDEIFFNGRRASAAGVVLTSAKPLL